MTDTPRPDAALATILASAFGSGDGAYAWKKEALPDVIDALTAAGRAVVGGEVWGLQGFEILGAVPTRRGPTRIFAWSAPGKSPDTDWPTFLHQCVRYAHEAIRRLRAESEVAPEFSDKLVYHLQFFSQEEYPHPPLQPR
ncbi:MAG: hypothetical protein QNJ48_07255 [Desulfobacterales bacterium]|nr:hypothetical protein [Desulfobacterales bacterium]MDJ0876150.1 hypothetical protein [Desulfobacterales bacterium]MDJ0883941.1 hypothetical protein [Desulfobacterales bacterium]